MQCLDILGKQEPHKGFSQGIVKVREDVEAGAALADAMKSHPKTFDALYADIDRGRGGGGASSTPSSTAWRSTARKRASYQNDVHQAVLVFPVAVVVVAVPDRPGVIVWKVILPDLRRSCSPVSVRNCRCQPGSSSGSATGWCRGAGWVSSWFSGCVLWKP